MILVRFVFVINLKGCTYYVVALFAVNYHILFSEHELHELLESFMVTGVDRGQIRVTTDCTDDTDKYIGSA